MRLPIIAILCACVRFSAVFSQSQLGSSRPDEISWKAVHKAVKNGNQKEALLLLDSKKLNGVDESGNAALILAAERGFEKIAQLLIRKGAYVNAVDENSNTPLLWAAYTGQASIARMLIENGADINAINSNFKNSALIVAIFQEFEEIAELLIEKGADVSIVGFGAETALTQATNHGFEKIAEKLIQRGADVNVAVKFNDTSLIRSALKGYGKIVQMLIENGANVNAANDDGNTPLLFAVSKGHESIVRQLVENGADVNVISKYNDTALNLALKGGSDKIAEILIQKGADVNFVAYGDDAPLIWAIENKFVKVIEKLIQKGVNINFMGENERPALLYAAFRGVTNAVELLIRSGADINILGQGGNTAIILAAKGGFKKIVELLIENGADVNIVNENNESALLSAIYAGYGKITELLVRNGANVNIIGRDGKTALVWSAEQGFYKAVQLIIDRGVNVNAVDDNKKSALVYAAEKGYEQIVRILVDADPNSLHAFAAIKGSEVNVELLIKNGANVNAVNENGTTALMVAAKNGNVEVMKLLLQNNATDVNAVDRDGHTALDAVPTAIEGHENLIRLLTERGAQYEGVELYKRTFTRACQLYTKLTSRWRYGTGLRVYDGSLAEAGEFPWMVALGYLNRQYKIDFSCGGSLISDEFVLTAAHCVKDIRRPVVARLGKITITDEDEFKAENQNIKQIIRHPGYSLKSKKNDIALIRLVDRLSLTEFIQPVCLNTDLKDLDARVELIVAGWGITNSGKSSNDLRKIELQTMPLSACNADLLDYNKQRNQPSFRSGIDESQYCAHDPVGGKDSCQGDSGGPLQTIQSYSNPAKVVGVVSFGIGCGRGRPGIYTRVARYMEWIGSHVWPNGNIDTPRININSV